MQIRTMRQTIRLLATAFLLLSFRPALPEDSASLAERLASASKRTALDDAGLKPWYLKIDVQLYDEKGKPSEQGTVEEWWAAPDRQKRVYTLPSGTLTEVRDSGRLYRQRGAFYPSAVVQLLLDEVVHPMPSLPEIAASQPESRSVNFGKVSLECIMLTQPIQGVKTTPMGLFPTYCFDPGKDVLRTTFNFGTQLVIRNQIGGFQGKLLPIDVVVRNGQVMEASGHVSVLTTQEVTDADLATGAMMDIGDQAVRLSSATMAGTILRKPDPVYPENAKIKGIQGTVILHALIGTDGHVHRLTVVSSPDGDLAVAAIAAVRQWTYKPYFLNGVPAPVDTTMTVNFQFGH